MQNTELETIETATLDNVTGGGLADFFKKFLPGGGDLGPRGSENLFAPGGGPQTPRGNGLLGKLFGNAGEG